MFHAAMCPSSGELLYQYDTWFMSLCADDRLVRIPYQTVIYTVWYKPGVTLIQWFSWWWAHGCQKHVENGNKHTWKIARHVGYLEGLLNIIFDLVRTGSRGFPSSQLREQKYIDKLGLTQQQKRERAFSLGGVTWHQLPWWGFARIPDSTVKQATAESNASYRSSFLTLNNWYSVLKYGKYQVDKVHPRTCHESSERK